MTHLKINELSYELFFRIAANINYKTKHEVLNIYLSITYNRVIYLLLKNILLKNTKFSKKQMGILLLRLIKFNSFVINSSKIFLISNLCRPDQDELCCQCLVPHYSSADIKPVACKNILKRHIYYGFVPFYFLILINQTKYKKFWESDYCKFVNTKIQKPEKSPTKKLECYSAY